MSKPIRYLLLPTVFFLILAETAAATVIYEFRRTTDPTVIGTIEFAEPPASASAGWTSTNSADLVSLFLDDGLFGLGTGNVLASVTGFLTYDVASLTGSELDFAFGIQDLTPGGAAGGISDFFQLGFSSNAGQDVVESFANANFVIGDWTLRAGTSAPITEPFTLGLLGAGLVGLGWARRRRSSSRSGR